MSVFWLSWWDTGGPPGEPTEGVEVWVTGYRGEGCEQSSVCARVEAEGLKDAWDKADRYYPGAAKAERRFEEEKSEGWRPPQDRFPR